jgi:branched-chain amino acid transport system substrate-binding protein
MMRTMLSRAAVLVAVAIAATACSKASASQPEDDSGTVYFGVSGPQTGQNAEYGRYFDQGFTIALDEINAAGGIDGRTVALKWEDSQSDPKQTGPIAQKFVADPSVIAELGDFSSPASMAASAIYQQAGLVQFGFTNSNPDFTKGGDHMWSTSLTQDYFQKVNADTVAKYAKAVAVVYQQTDWGASSFDAFRSEAAKIGLKITYSSPFQPDGTDFRPILIKARDSRPDAVVHLGYGPDGALIVKQLRDVGFTGRFFGGQNTPQFLQLAGAAAEGDILEGAAVVLDPDPTVQAFVAKFRARYGTDPGDFQVDAYDALTVVVAAAKLGGATRAGVLKGLQQGTFPSLQFGSFTFGSDRRPGDVPLKELIVRNGQFVLNTDG